MASSILLINANRCRSPYPVYPLGLSHIGAALQQQGHTVRIIDSNFDNDHIESILKEFSPRFVGLSLRNIDDVNIETQTYFVPDLVDLVHRCRAVTSVPVIVGGSAFSLFPVQLLEATGADFGVQGEGETAVKALITALENGHDYSRIPGLVFRTDRGITANPGEQFLDGAQIGPALRPSALSAQYLAQSSVLNIQSQRGCAFTCCYCTYPVIEGTRFRFREPGLVVDEMEQAKMAGAHYVFFVDSVFNTSTDHVAAICKEILSRDLRMHWSCFLRPQGLTRELMQLMGDAGLQHIEFGTDSLCDSVLQSYGKQFTFDDIYQASALARACRIWHSHFLIIGGPGETAATIEEGFVNSLRLRKTVMFPFVGMRLYPQTSLYERALREKVVTPDTNLLKPFFYLAPELTLPQITAHMNSCSARSRSWIYGELPDQFIAVSQKLRQRGVEGPLWEYLIVNAEASA